MSDEIAVTVEPVAGGVRAALRAGVEDGDTVAVIGAGPMGLVTVAALRNLTAPGSIMVGAKYPVQQDLAAEFGADVVTSPDELGRAVRRATGSSWSVHDSPGVPMWRSTPVGSAESITQAIGLCRPRGRVVLLGMPGVIDVDLTPVPRTDSCRLDAKLQASRFCQMDPREVPGCFSNIRSSPIIALSCLPTSAR